MLDLSGLDRIHGVPRTLGERLLAAAADRGLHVHVAVAGTRMAARLLAVTRPGLTVVAPGDEPATLAPLPLDCLKQISAHEARPVLEILKRWGLKTLGDLAALPPVSLFERLGQAGIRWQRAARGVDLVPLVAETVEAPWEATFELEWPVDTLEPLSFVFGRLFDKLCARLVREVRAAAGVHVVLGLVTREVEVRTLQLPAPIDEARVLRTLVLLDLESRAVAAGVDRVTVRVDPTPAPVVQYSLLERARPKPERLSTLAARLSALMGEGRVGSASLVDSHRPGAFEMTTGRDWVWNVSGADGAIGPRGWGASAVAGQPDPGQAAHAGSGSGRPDSRLEAGEVRLALRRFRWSVPARVLVQGGRPVRMTTDRHDLAGGRVESCAGPWRTSGEWWQVGDARPRARPGEHVAQVGWDRDEWDVALSDGALYRVYRDRTGDRWFVDGIVD